LWLTLIFKFICVKVTGICVGIRSTIFNILGERISRNLRKDFYYSLIYKDIGFFDANRTGDLISRLNSDIQVIQDTLGSNFSVFVRAVIFIITVIIILLVISPTLTGVTFAGIVPLALFSAWNSRLMRSMQRDIQKEKSSMNTIAEESFANIRTVKAFSNEDEEI
jgi:ABC-type multidrug transport system fused ATPase/permease subunit